MQKIWLIKLQSNHQSPLTLRSESMCVDVSQIREGEKALKLACAYSSQPFTITSKSAIPAVLPGGFAFANKKK